VIWANTGDSRGGRSVSIARGGQNDGGGISIGGNGKVDLCAKGQGLGIASGRGGLGVAVYGGGVGVVRNAKPDGVVGFVGVGEGGGKGCAPLVGVEGAGSSGRACNLDKFVGRGAVSGSAGFQAGVGRAVGGNGGGVACGVGGGRGNGDTVGFGGGVGGKGGNADGVLTACAKRDGGGWGGFEGVGVSGLGGGWGLGED
jgi:hypothetical protein